MEQVLHPTYKKWGEGGGRNILKKRAALQSLQGSGLSSQRSKEKYPHRNKSKDK